MTAEHHVERHELNRRARELLVADGTLTGPEFVVGGLGFRSGDEVIARVGDRELRAQGVARDSYVRNGSLGRVAEVGTEGVVVDFERWGRVSVPRSYLEHELPCGGGGALQHAYALTTHAAQGETFARAATLVTDQSTPAGLYVAVTRGQHDLTAEMVHGVERIEKRDDDLPALRDATSVLDATARRLASGAAVPQLAVSLLRHEGRVQRSETSSGDPLDEHVADHAQVRRAASAVRGPRM